MKLQSDVEKAYREALKARTHSYSPYSKFAVGAALKVRGEEVAVAGCNVENASFGATICAERVALGAAVARKGRLQPEFMVIVTGEEQATVPCALCLQMIAEFCPDDFAIYSANEKAVLKKFLLKDLLPHPFRQFEPGQ